MFTNKKREITPLNDLPSDDTSPHPAANLDTSKIYPTPLEPAAFELPTQDKTLRKDTQKEKRIKTVIFLIGLLYIIGPLLSVATYTVLHQLLILSTGHQINIQNAVGLFFQLSLIILLPSLLPILLGIGIIARKHIARKATVLLLEVGIAATIISVPFRIGDLHSLATHYFPDFLPYVYTLAAIGWCVGITVSIMMLNFLTRNSVKQYFS